MWAPLLRGGGGAAARGSSRYFAAAARQVPACLRPGLPCLSHAGFAPRLALPGAVGAVRSIAVVGRVAAPSPPRSLLPLWSSPSSQACRRWALAAPSGAGGPLAAQTRAFAGRTGGFKRKKKATRTRTIHQQGLGKRMEMYWPKYVKFRSRVPMFENSRRHIIYAHHLRRWMVMWYRHGIQVFRTFPARAGKFEQGRMCAMLFYEQLRDAGKLGHPKPDQCRSGVRGVYFDKEERSWVARWSSSGLKKYSVYSTEKMGFHGAYQQAVRSRVQNIRQQHQFVFQRTRWRGQRRPLGQSQT